MKVDVRLSGDADILRAISGVKGGPAVERAKQRALAAGARVARKAARKTAAFRDRTGRLRKSIRVKSIRARGGRGAGAILMAGGKDARQAHLIEFGHGGPRPAPAHPFLEPAVLETQTAAFEAVASRARSELDKLARNVAPARRGRR